MDAATRDRLFGYQHAFDHPVTLGISIAVIAVLVVAYAAIYLLHAAKRTDAKLHDELLKRVRSWAVMAPLLIAPVLLGAAWTIAGVALLSVLCYREYARATGLFRFRAISAVVVFGLACLTFAIADHWYGFFAAIPPLTVVLIAMVAILKDEPKGYIQRVGLGAIGFLLFGVCFGHLGYMANDADFRPIVLLILVTVELNDVFAYISGKTLGRRKLVPNTSPNKTIGGAVGALVLTTTLVAVLGHFVFAGTRVDGVLTLVGLGLIVSVAGQFGDLMLSSIKRDIGIKDMGATIPGHGGLLDRFDSLILVAPAVFHYVAYLRGFGTDQVPRIMSGGG
ncbi:MAG: phosphatidate cytidylyltransferase [Sphingobacteriales bacterium]|nr:MAG: phosphatidate cytidylyltransferase [Sphingobacteriales bacterium]